MGTKVRGGLGYLDDAYNRYAILKLKQMQTVYDAGVPPKSQK
jgi:hypothetical protein